MKHTRPENEYILPIALLLTIATIIGSLAIKLLPAFPLEADAVGYFSTARSLIESGEYILVGGNAYPPGYPLFLVLLFGILGMEAPVIYMTQFILLGAQASFVYLIARKHLSLPKLFAFLPSLAVLLWPYMTLYAMLVLSEILYTTILIASVYFLLEFVKAQSMRAAILPGILLGLATLTKPVAFLLPLWLLLVYGLYITLCTPQRFLVRATAKRWALFIATPLIVISLWTGYAEMQYGVSSTPLTFFPGILEKTLNLAYEAEAPKKDIELGEANTDVAVPESEGELMRAEKPALSSILVSKLQNIYRFWNPGAGGYQAAAYKESMPLVSVAIILYKIGYFVILALAFLSLLLYKRIPVALLWISIFYFWALHSVLWPYPRYTLPIIPLVILLAATSIYFYKDILERLKELPLLIRPGKAK